MKRRDFLSMATKTTAGVGALSFFPFKAATAKSYYDPEFDGAEPHRLDYDRSGWGVCTVNCGARCPLHVRIKDGRIKYVETDNTTDDKVLGSTNQVRACVRGRSTKYRVYNPRRLKYPMKRVGKRGEGKFKRISWNEAFEIIADKMKYTKEKYGNEAFYSSYGTGVLGGVISKSWPPASSVFSRLMNLYGGHTDCYNDYSVANLEETGPAVFGGWLASSDISNVSKADLVMSFGENPCETRMSGGSHNYYYMKNLEMLKGKGKFILVDPRLTDTGVNKADEWVPLRPGTDAALIAGIMHVLITKGKVAQDFLDRCTIGFDEHTLPEGAPKNSSYKSYIMGKGKDGIEKTPAWAAKICGLTEKQILGLAEQIGNAKRIFISQGWGPQRHSNGDEISRAVMLLAAATGNIGNVGNSSGARTGGTGGSGGFPVKRFPITPNPVKQKISFFTWTDAIANHENMTAKNFGVRGADKLKAPIKFLVTYGGNPLNQHADINKTKKILADESLCEFILDVNISMTPHAKFADLVLPDATHFEQHDIAEQGDAGNMAYVILASKAIDPLHETMTVYDMCTGIADKLGLKKQFTEGKTHDEWVKELWAESVKAAKKVGYNPPDWEGMLKMGIYKHARIGGNMVAYEDFAKDPAAHPLPTKSGKIELYSQKAAQLNDEWVWDSEDDKISVIPQHKPRFNSYVPGSSILKKYPFQLFGFHAKGHTHSSYYDIDVIREVNPPSIWMNEDDAMMLGINDMDNIYVYNQYGKIMAPVRLTRRVRPGVLASEQGVWHKDENGIDIGGAINSLTTQKLTALAKANGQHSNLVQVEKAPNL